MSSGWGFVNPPDMDVWGDFSSNSIFVGDSRVNLVWKAPDNTAMALRLYQANLSTGAVLDDFEYILGSSAPTSPALVLVVPWPCPQGIAVHVPDLSPSQKVS